MKEAEGESSTTSISIEVEALLDEAIGSLSQADREIVLMRFYDQLTFGEIARELGAKEDTVGRRSARALDKMRCYFERRNVAISSLAIVNLITAELTRSTPQACRIAVLKGFSIAKSQSLNGSDGALHQKGLSAVMKTTTFKVTALGIGVVLLIDASIGFAQHTKTAQKVTIQASAAVTGTNAKEGAAIEEIRRDLQTYMKMQYEGRPVRPAFVDRAFTIEQDNRTSFDGGDASYARMTEGNSNGWRMVKNPSASVVITSFRLDGDKAAVGWRLTFGGTWPVSGGRGIPGGHASLRIRTLSPPFNGKPVVGRWSTRRIMTS